MQNKRKIFIVPSPRSPTPVGGDQACETKVHRTLVHWQLEQHVNRLQACTYGWPVSDGISSGQATKIIRFMLILSATGWIYSFSPWILSKLTLISIETAHAVHWQCSTKSKYRSRTLSMNECNGPKTQIGGSWKDIFTLVAFENALMGALICDPLFGGLWLNSHNCALLFLHFLHRQCFNAAFGRIKSQQHFRSDWSSPVFNSIFSLTITTDVNRFLNCQVNCSSSEIQPKNRNHHPIHHVAQIHMLSYKMPEPQ